MTGRESLGVFPADRAVTGACDFCLTVKPVVTFADTDDSYVSCGDCYAAMEEADRAARSDPRNEVVAAARVFVSTTSWFRQPKASRDAFERLAVALLSANLDGVGADCSHEEPESSPREPGGHGRTGGTRPASGGGIL